MKWVGYPLLYPVFTRRYAMEHSLVLRNQRVMLDRDLAMFYGVETRALNQQRERN
jgi:hypothetical protein